MKPVRILSHTAVALAVVIGSTTPTLARVCEGVMFYYTHGTDGPIWVTGVRYPDLNSGNPRAWRVEDVNNDHAPAVLYAIPAGMISARSPARVRTTI